MKPQRKPKTPETHKAAPDAPERRMNTAELAEARRRARQPATGPMATRKEVADMFLRRRDVLIEAGRNFAFRQGSQASARQLADRYDLQRAVLESDRILAREQFPDDPALPKMPSRAGNDFYALADYCTTAAANTLAGGKAQDGAGGKAETPTGNGNADRISTKEAIQGWHTSRATLKRYREEGKLTGYRPPDAPDNAPYSYAAADLDNHFTRRKRPLGGPRA